MRKGLSHIYSFSVGLRNSLYDLGILKAFIVVPFVISIGNIEAGGTGKTPFTIALALALKDRGYRVCIVTRGYKGRRKGTMLVSAQHSAKDVGDEALLMARSTGLPVIKSPDRLAGATYASRELAAEIIILDDAFQHRRIHRDYNICLVSTRLDQEALLPLGCLREGASALKRADLVVSTKDSSSGSLTADLVAVGLVDRFGNPVMRQIAGDVLAFCGIAKPESFFQLIKASGARVDTMRFRDHHPYTRGDIRRIRWRARGKDLIITTEKDLIRLMPEQLDGRWHALRVKMEIPELDRIIEEIETRVKNRRISR